MTFYNQQKGKKWPVSLCNDYHCDVGSHVNCNEVLGEGVGKTAYCGRYCGAFGRDKKRNQKAVVKFYKKGFVFETDFWTREIQGHEKACKLAEAWNNSKHCNYPIRVLVPVQNKLVGSKGSGHREIGEYCLVEDYLDHFEKFNSNTMTVGGCENMCIQAFSHWTYHHTNGQHLFVDCQGSIDNKRGYRLTDPVIVSKNAFWTSSYGPCDGGKDMMITWFENHQCNEYCQRHWKRAVGQKQVYIKPTTSTTYVWNVPKQNKEPVHRIGYMRPIYE